LSGSSQLQRRGPERTLGLAIAWFLAIPAFVIGYASIIWPLGYLLPHDCFSADCPAEGPANLVPPFLLPAAALLIAAFAGSIVLRRAVYGRSRAGWRAVAAIGAFLMVLAVALNIWAGGHWEVVLISFVWPFTPGLVALDAAWRARRNRGAS
jgi:hypothetical protein